MTDKLSVADDWIEWNGGECPVGPGSLVETIMRHETAEEHDTDQCLAGSYLWDHDGGAWDIIAYRLARERGL